MRTRSKEVDWHSVSQRSRDSIGERGQRLTHRGGDLLAFHRREIDGDALVARCTRIAKAPSCVQNENAIVAGCEVFKDYVRGSHGRRLCLTGENNHSFRQTTRQVEGEGVNDHVFQRCGPLMRAAYLEPVIFSANDDLAAGRCRAEARCRRFRSARRFSRLAPRRESSRANKSDSVGA